MASINEFACLAKYHPDLYQRCIQPMDIDEAAALAGEIHKRRAASFARSDLLKPTMEKYDKWTSITTVAGVALFCLSCFLMAANMAVFGITGLALAGLSVPVIIFLRIMHRRCSAELKSLHCYGRAGSLQGYLGHDPKFQQYALTSAETKRTLDQWYQFVFKDFARNWDRHHQGKEE